MSQDPGTRAARGGRRAAWRGGAATLAIAFSLSACAINQTVDAIEPQPLSMLCVKENDAVLMDGFLPAVQKQIERKEIPYAVYKATPPEDCSHFMHYSANWRWDMAMYLSYAEFTILSKAGKVGEAVYDARFGGWNFNKFGSTEAKITPMLDQLFSTVTIEPAPPLAAQAAE